MISELHIEQYRGIKNLTLNELGKINIIAGANNTGKTSVLEVIRSLESPNDLRRWRLIGRREERRRIATTVYDTMKSIFPDGASSDAKRIKYSGKVLTREFTVELLANVYDTIVAEQELNEANSFYEGRKYVDAYGREYEVEAMEITYIVDGDFSGKDKIYSMQRGINYLGDNKNKQIVDRVIYISPTQHTQDMFFLDSILNNPNLYEQFVEIMRQFDPGFISINSVQEEGMLDIKYVVLSKNHHEGLLLNAYGDGMKKAMLLLSSVVKAQEGGILLLDEFETAIHVSVMRDVFKWVIETAYKLDVQIFMTSHSLEAIEEVLKCTPSIQKDMRMITLVKVDDEVRVRNVDGEKAIQLLDEYGLELR